MTYVFKKATFLKTGIYIKIYIYIYIYIRRVILGKSCIMLYHWYNVFDVCDRWLMFFFLSLPDLKSSLIVMSKESGHLVSFFVLPFINVNSRKI